MSLTLIIVIMTSLISYQAFEDPSKKIKLVMHPARVKEFGEVYRFLTSGFVHSDWMHLLFNMYVLYVIGEQVETAFLGYFGPGMGRIFFISLYFGAIIISSIPSYLKHQDNYGYSGLGASGGTSAIICVYAFFFPWKWFLIPPLPGIFLAIGFVLYSDYMERKAIDKIGHGAHLWGAAFGITFIIAISLAFNHQLWQLFINQLLQGPSLPSF